ncbi:MAG: crosslink repair DNA glycosylase YcaQ family protein, partial [Actinomycetota bacterium]|nr:crosslink repair DNA glycosylase YcaQ family protein [Actinomycetota bacterium]
MKKKTDLEIDAVSAKRIAVAAQGLGRQRPEGKVDRRHFRRSFGDLGLVQLDSVQAVCRSHYLVFFSRLGKYDRLKLDDWIWHSGEIFESWAHEAS